MRFLWLGVCCLFPVIAEAARAKSSGPSVFAICVILFIPGFLLVMYIGSSIYDWIAQKAISNYKQEMQNVRDRCEQEKRNCLAECEQDKANCMAKFLKMENELKAQFKSFENKLSESYKFRESLLSMRELFSKGDSRIEDCKKIDQYFVQIKKRQDFLASWEKDLENKDLQKQRSLNLDKKKHELKHKEIQLTKKENDLKKLETDIQNSVDCLQNSVDCLQNSYPPLAAAIADFCVQKISAYENFLRTKPHPAEKKANILSETKQQLKHYIQQYHEIKYLLNSYEVLFPWIVEFREFSVEDIEQYQSPAIADASSDNVLRYVSQAEYRTLSPVERNQKALNRYIESHKSKVQIGRLYERFIGFEYEKQGYQVKYFGALEGKEDLGRDLIAQKGSTILIIQCKYWAKEKTIRENAICQLYGTGLKYKIEHKGNKYRIKNVLVTSTSCSEMAHEFAKALDIDIIENYPLKNYPMVKCNIGKDGEKIYHLPFDQMYDRVKIEPEKGEKYAENCLEAELLGFRRAFKWHGEQL